MNNSLNKDKPEGDSNLSNGTWNLRNISIDKAHYSEFGRGVDIEQNGHVKTISELVGELEKLFSSQNLAVLATSGESGPYGNLVAFMASPDLKYLLFATQKATRKFGNLLENPFVAFVIDNRSNKVDDFMNAVAVTALGKAFELKSREKVTLVEAYIDKHPHLKDFVSSPSCALVKVEIEKYVCVFRFQNVIELYPKNE